MGGSTAESASSLPYHEPGIITILVHTSFLLLLNVVNAALDKVLYCGLLGQVLIGIAWGTPGAKWLTVSVEETIVQLGYLGLILLVYEGMLFSPLSACSIWKARSRQFCNVKSSPISTKYCLTHSRRLKHVFPITQGQSNPLFWRCSHWHRSPHWSLLHASRTTRCFSSTSLRCRRCALLDQSWHDLHSSQR
jgi:hypothetical protein